MLFFTIIFIMAALGCYFKWKNRRFEKLSAKLKGPPVYPIIGSCLQFCLRPQSIDITNLITDSFLLKINDFTLGIFFFLGISETFLDITQQLHLEPGKFWLGSVFCVILSKPEDLEVIYFTKLIINIFN